MKKNIRLVSLTFLACWQAASNSSVSATQAQQGPKASPPILVTSCGQSEGPSSLNTILKRVGVAYDIAPLATVKDLKAKSYKTLIITMGASLKGMGAAGIAIDDELMRISELIDAAKKDKITIVGAHIEGMKRRAQGAEAGDTTDEQSIDTVAPKSDILFIKKEGNEDGRFTIIAQAKKIPMIEFEKNMDMVAELTKLFK